MSLKMFGRLQKQVLKSEFFHPFGYFGHKILVFELEEDKKIISKLNCSNQWLALELQFNFLMDCLSNIFGKVTKFEAKMAKMSKNIDSYSTFNLFNFVKSKCKIIKTWRLHHWLALEQYFILVIDFRSIIELEVAEFVVQNCPIYKKIHFFFICFHSQKKKLGCISIKIFFTSC